MFSHVTMIFASGQNKISKLDLIILQNLNYKQGEVKMFIKDRGNKKWTSLMLIEHKRKLKQLKEGENHKEKPDLDKQQLQEMNYLFNKAIHNDLTVKIVYFDNHNQQYHTLYGKIKSYLEHKQKLIVVNDNNSYTLNSKNIINLELDSK